MPGAESKCSGQKSIIKNLLVGLTVSFVALSLGAAFGVLSGRGAFSGMISAALLATITSIFGGTRIQCSGPTGPMTTVTALLVAFSHDHIAAMLPNVNPDHFVNITLILTAVITILFGILRLGKFITLIPNVVISGFMNGIAIIIFLDQIKKIFGLYKTTPIGGTLILNIILIIISLLIIFLLPKITNKLFPKIASYLSATFITIIVGTLFATLAGWNVETVSLGVSLHSFSDFTNLVLSQLPTTWSWEIIRYALPFAIQLSILCYLDTLMTSLVVDKITKEKTKPNKELAAQGISIGTVALVGGIPGAQATIRSVLMVKEKATLRLAGISVGIFALLEILAFQNLVSLIPQAVLSGILIKVAYDVFDWTPVRLYLKELFKQTSVLLHSFFSRHDDELIFITNREMLMIIGTTLVTVLFNLNIAVGVFTVLFYLHNLTLMKHNPMRDLKPVVETEGFSDEG